MSRFNSRGKVAAVDPNATSSAPDPPPDSPATRSAHQPPKRLQRAGFSVFFDVFPDEETTRLETRIYHEESGQEVAFSGAEPDVWTAWILERIRATGEDVKGFTAGRPAIVELEASIAFIGGTASRARTVRVNVRSGVDGPVDLERQLGAAFVRAVAQLLDAGEG
jgi:hypothetical protein